MACVRFAISISSKTLLIFASVAFALEYSTALLARRHLVEAHKDKCMLSPYPVDGLGAEKESEDPAAVLDRVFVYADPTGLFGSIFDANGSSQQGKKKKQRNKKEVEGHFNARTPRVAIVTYGNGVPLALEAAMECKERMEIAVIDTPRLGGVPEGLVSLLKVSLRLYSQ